MKAEKEAENRQKIQKACELLRQSVSLCAEADKLLRQCGVILCTVYRGSLVPNAETEIHVYSGIKKLSRLTDAELVPMIDYFGDEIAGQKAVVADGICFFQLGKAAKSDYKYR